eukprot:gnl/TRDRNA2_/TRDRNA2_150192_c1_seq4.p2 gnl/TRDRNA2_/TRDRNA2_150192_c1~~gnl/TRDRNA2_/TRDRNA2_150192_c1_seq4.p2  ORF type:complete len:112 (-),score=19.83 gnl/TRDRNA2_/TRDRNA2_150192_c1_seq4:103-438(-)
MRSKYSPERWFKLQGPVEELICTFAKLFVGTEMSTFSGHIQRMRIHSKAPNTMRLVHTDYEHAPVQQIDDELDKYELDKWDTQHAKHTFVRLPPNTGDDFAELDIVTHGYV